MVRHKPVLLKEVLQLLDLHPGERVVDGTLGSGGHAVELAKAVGPQGRLIGIDWDPESIPRAEAQLRAFSNIEFQVANFAEIGKVLENLNLREVDAVLLDIGFSSDQLEDPERGFSFEREGPLDMRLNPEIPIRARDLVNDLSQNELEGLFRKYGDEKRARAYARVLVEARKKKPIQTTRELVEALGRVFPPSRGKRPSERNAVTGRHFATKVFQALRIAVNQELANLESGLQNIWERLKPGGRLAVISFHSLEDRIVKQTFRAWQRLGAGELLVKKPITASWAQRKENPRSRSAKLRGIRKSYEGRG